MKGIRARVILGILLVAGGILFLLQNMGVLQFANLIFPILFGLAGIYVLSFFINNRNNWWALIPSIILFALAVITALEVIAPRFSEIWGGPIFLGGIGLSFWIIYLIEHRNWWAVIPGGVLLTLAVVAGLSSTNSGLETGGIFFMGLGLTFGLLSILPSPEGRLKWAVFPSVILFAIGIILIASVSGIFNYIWPIALILAGLYIAYRAFGFRKTYE